MTGTHTASPNPKRAWLSGTLSVKSSAPIRRAHSRGVRRRTLNRPLPAASKIWRPLPPRGVRRHPAMPSMRSSAMDFPLRTRRKTVPYRTTLPRIIACAWAACFGLIWLSIYSQRWRLHHIWWLMGRSSRMSLRRLVQAGTGGNSRMRQLMSGCSKMKLARAGGRVSLS